MNTRSMMHSGNITTNGSYNYFNHAMQTHMPVVIQKPLPFYNVEWVILKPIMLQNTGKQPNQDVLHTFTLNSKQASDIASNRDMRTGTPKYDYQLQLRFTMCDSTIQSDDCFPHNCVVKVNNKICPLPNPIPTNKPQTEPKRPPRPVNITPNVKLAPMIENQIHISWCSELNKTYFVAIYLVKKLTSNDLLQLLINKGIQPAENTQALIKDKFKADADNDIATTELRVSLLCPLGKMRMSNPCRASTCLHLQCFDASAYLQMNEKKPTWNCPVCDKPAIYDTLAIDGYFQNVLASQKLSLDDTDIQLYGDGSWSTQRLQASSVTIDASNQSIELITDDLDELLDNVHSGNDILKKEFRNTMCEATSTSNNNCTVVDLTISDSEDESGPLSRNKSNPPRTRAVSGNTNYKISNAATENQVISLDSPSPPASSPEEPQRKISRKWDEMLNYFMPSFY